jgi:hypothetical protein
LQAAVQKSPADRQTDVQSELRFAQAAALHFQSVANQTRFVAARNVLANASDPLSTEEKQRLRADILRILKSEIALAHEMFRLAREDSRIGFEASNQYVFVPLDLAEKVVNCRWLLEQFQQQWKTNP